MIKKIKNFFKNFLIKSAEFPQILSFFAEIFVKEQGLHPASCVFTVLHEQDIVFREIFKKILKKSEKICKKVLTFWERCDILHERSKREHKNNGPRKLNNNKE